MIKFLVKKCIKNANDVCCPLCGQKLEEKGRLTTIINMKKDLFMQSVYVSMAKWLR